MADNIGKRCEFDGNYGTVKYFGYVEATSGLWYGIDWDEQRGKHNGAYNGRLYFICRDGYGSFVRPQRLNFGIRMIDAIEKRYGSLSDDIGNQSLYVLDANNQRTSVEAVGFEKWKTALKQLKNLRRVALVRMHVREDDDNDDKGSAASLIPNVNDLDISCNLFSSWSDILTIIEKMKNLQILNISGNYLSNTKSISSHPPVIQSLKVIFANRMKIGWKKVISWLLSLPNLEELHMCFNGINCIESHDDVFKSIRLLNLEGNELDDWNEIRKLSNLKSLEVLILNENKFSSISFSNTDSFIGFESLRSISLNSNKISDWLSINQLVYLKSLQMIKFKLNPLCEGQSSFDVRQELIARLKQIEVVNGSEVDAKERSDAELLYMKKYASLWRDHVASKIELKLKYRFQNDHPRFEELIKTYGVPAESRKTTRTLKDSLIPLCFQCPDITNSKIITKKVPITMTIQQLKNLLQRMFKIKAIDQNLSYFDSKTKKTVGMDDNSKDLEFYSISPDDVIIVKTD